MQLCNQPAKSSRAEPSQPASQRPPSPSVRLYASPSHLVHAAIQSPSRKLARPHALLSGHAVPSASATTSAAMQRNAVRWSAMRCDAMLCNAMLCDVMAGCERRVPETRISVQHPASSVCLSVSVQTGARLRACGRVGVRASFLHPTSQPRTNSRKSSLNSST